MRGRSRPPAHDRRQEPAGPPGLQSLAVEFSRNHSPAIQEDALRDAWPWASRLAQGVARHSGAEPEVVHQVAGIALFTALERYNPSRGDFLTFARATIAGEVRHFLRDTVWPVHITRTLQDHSRLTAIVHDDLVQQLGREPTPAMVADAAELTLPDTVQALGMRRSAAPLEERSPQLSGIDDDLDQVPDRVDLVRAIRLLKPGERRLLELRFYHGCTQEEIAALLGTNQVRISRMLARTLLELRRLLDGS